jgi:hypothetical protein
VHSPPPRLKLARPRSQNVFHPVTLRSVGKSDDVPTVGGKGVDWSAVSTARLSTDVAHDRKPRQVSGYPQGQAVGETSVEASYTSRYWQLTSSLLGWVADDLIEHRAGKGDTVQPGQLLWQPFVGFDRPTKSWCPREVALHSTLPR